jgi:hypothetical protein
VGKNSSSNATDHNAEGGRVGSEPLEFILRFVKRDLSKLDPQELVRLADELTAFVGMNTPVGGGILVFAVPPGPPTRFPTVAIIRRALKDDPQRYAAFRQTIKDQQPPYKISSRGRTLTIATPHPSGKKPPLINADLKVMVFLQHQAKWLIDAMLQKAGPDAPPHEQKFLLVGDVHFKVNVCYPTHASRWRPTIVLFGDVAHLFALRLSHELAGPAGPRVRQCPECNEIFLRVRKQQYCSRRCVNRANKRAWLATPQGRRKNREADRRRYERRVHERLNAAVKVQRRVRGRRL